MNQPGDNTMPQRTFAEIVHRLLLAGCVAALTTGAAFAGSIEVRLKLPVRAGLDLEGRRTLATCPFIVVRQEGEGGSSALRGRQIDVQEEFERYLVKVLRRDTDLKISEIGPVSYPTYDFAVLEKDTDFWRVLGERSNADLVLCGSLDFDIQDRSGYRMEEYVSPYDGRTYYRQVLVEQTGFEYDILMLVFDGDTGRTLYSDNFKDFKSFEGESTDPLSGMFQNLFALEDRIAGIFTQKEVEASRVLFTD